MPSPPSLAMTAAGGEGRVYAALFARTDVYATRFDKPRITKSGCAPGRVRRAAQGTRREPAGVRPPSLRLPAVRASRPVAGPG